MHTNYFDEVTSFKNLMKAAHECERGVRWKCSTQMFEMKQSQWCSNLSKQLRNGTYKSKKFHEFDIVERGKPRHIQAVHISDRTVQKSLNNNALKPLILPKLIYDNSASVKGKGTEFAVRRIRQHLASHYRKHGRNGGILIMDIHDYFGSIDHDILFEQLERVVPDERVLKLTKYFIDQFPRGIGLGSEICQTCAIFYPNDIDHMIKEKLHIQEYARYNDDSYIIHEDIEYLKECLNIVREKYNSLSLSMNNKRTHIIPFNGGTFHYLKRRFCVTESGKIIMRPERSNITKERNKVKKHAKKLNQGEIDSAAVDQSYKSWRSYASRCDAYRTLTGMDNLYNKLMIEEWRQQ